jgi:hypothetical protein
VALRATQQPPQKDGATAMVTPFLFWWASNPFPSAKHLLESFDVRLLLIDDAFQLGHGGRIIHEAVQHLVE